MAIIVHSSAELLATLDRLVVERVDTAVVTAQKEVAAYCFGQWNDGKFTWSKWQKGDVWSGQSRASIRVAVGAPDRSYEPDNPGEWPNHGSPYPPRDVFDAMNSLSGLRAYQAVYISDNAPHMDLVEKHTQVGRMAAEFTRAHFGPGYSWGSSLIPDNIPF